MEIFTGAIKMAAINFATWMEDNGWQCVYSKELKKRAYVDCGVMKHGSDYHFTKIIKEHGKTLDELWELFVLHEQKRLKT